MSNPTTKPVRKFNMLDKLGYTLGDRTAGIMEAVRSGYKAANEI